MITIRQPLSQEQAAWQVLWQAYLEFYQCELDDSITNLTWQRFHNEQEPVYCVAAYDGNEMVGFVTYVLHRSTWASHYYCYFEDIFCLPVAAG